MAGREVLEQTFKIETRHLTTNQLVAVICRGPVKSCHRGKKYHATHPLYSKTLNFE